MILIPHFREGHWGRVEREVRQDLGKVTEHFSAIGVILFGEQLICIIRHTAFSLVRIGLKTALSISPYLHCKRVASRYEMGRIMYFPVRRAVFPGGDPQAASFQAKSVSLFFDETAIRRVFTRQVLWA
jgi:hypothetical protein